MYIGKFLVKSLIKKWNSTFNTKIYDDNGSEIRINLINLYNSEFKNRGVSDEILVDETIKPINVCYKTEDNINISANIYKLENSKKWIVGMHGYSSSKESVTLMVWFYRKLGYNIMVFDFRNHNDSDRDIVTFGLREQMDLMASITYINKNFDVDHIGLMGASMGAFTLNFFALNQEKFFIENKIAFGISDSTYISAKKVMETFISLEQELISKFLKGILKDAFEIYQEDYNVDLNKLSCEEEFIKSKKTFPILFLHSIEDAITDPNDSKKLYQIRKKLIKSTEDRINIFPSGDHLQTLTIYTSEYIESVTNFIEDVVKPK